MRSAGCHTPRLPWAYLEVRVWAWRVRIVNDVNDTTSREMPTIDSRINRATRGRLRSESMVCCRDSRKDRACPQQSIRRNLASAPEPWPRSSALAWVSGGDCPLTTDRDSIPPRMPDNQQHAHASVGHGTRHPAPGPLAPPYKATSCVPPKQNPQVAILGSNS